MTILDCFVQAIEAVETMLFADGKALLIMGGGCHVENGSKTETDRQTAISATRWKILEK